MREFWNTIRAKLFGPGSQFTQELDDEIRAHLQIEIDENIATGMSPGDARFAALRSFGNVSRAKESAREKWSFAWLDALLRDLRFTSRMLLSKPGFTLVAVLTLALGIGANAAIFTVINTVLFKSLPYPNTDRLVVLDEYKPHHGSRTVSWLDFKDWQAQAKVFEEMAAYRLAHVTLRGAHEPSLLSGAEVSASFFKLLGVQPLMGRTFNAADDSPVARQSVIVSYAFWRNSLRGDPNISGATLDLDGLSYSVLGVLPPEFNFFDKQVDVYLPVGLNGNDATWNRRGYHPDLLVLARLGAGFSLDSARSEMATIMRRLDQEYPNSNAGMLASVTPLYQFRFGSIQPLLLTLFAAVGCVLLIATVNVANLLLARASSRVKEMALRVALGAGAGRLIRQLITESIALSLLGAIVGLGFAFAGLHVLVGLAPPSLPQIAGAGIDGRVVLFTLLVSILTALVFGTVPAFHAARVDMNAAFKENSRGGGSGRAGKRLRSGLLICETAFALVLIMAAGLLIRSLFKASNVDPGFRPDNTLAMDVMLPPTRYTGANQQSVFFSQTVQRLKTVPGVETAGAAFCPPLVGVCASNAFMLADHPINSVADLATAASNIVVPGYFETLKVPLIEGRFFTGSDAQHSRLVAVVNRTFARRWWPEESAIGKLIREGGPERNEPYREIVGVVGDVKQNGMDGIQSPEVFFPVAQFPFAPWDSLQEMTLVMKTQGEPMAVVGAAKNAVWALDKDLPLTAIRPMVDDRAEALAARKFSTTLLAIFAGLALALAAVGIYGVMAYNVSQRRHEIGTRMALGAQPVDVRKLVLGEAALLAMKAVVLGSIGAWISSRWLKSLLFGIKAVDPLTFFVVCVILGIVVLAAAYIPMRRAIQVDPATALRAE
ncbi:MAG TPA: ABC transporter permease [Candidatus Angelobacter sp.]|nr:ABC transporter permease [Candidatus Angelobacter sp.]